MKLENYTVPSVARFRGCTTSTVYRAIWLGQLAATKQGRDWIVDPISLRTWIPQKTRGRPRKSLVGKH